MSGCDKYELQYGSTPSALMQLTSAIITTMITTQISNVGKGIMALAVGMIWALGHKKSPPEIGASVTSGYFSTLFAGITYDALERRHPEIGDVGSYFIALGIGSAWVGMQIAIYKYYCQGPTSFCANQENPSVNDSDNHSDNHSDNLSERLLSAPSDNQGSGPPNDPENPSEGSLPAPTA